MLIVDDDMHIRKLVLTYASTENFYCQEAENAQKALEQIEAEQFDIVILDIMMPGMDGFEALSKIKEISKVPVIMLSARSEEYDKLYGFNLGVDDYVVKPFSPKELMARVNAVLKRSGAEQEKSLSFGSLLIDPKARMAYADKVALTLRPKEYDLLLKLAQNARIVLTKDQLLESVWGYNYYGDARTLDTHIKLLRIHLGNCRQMIQTVWGVGYKFEYSEE